MEKEGVSIIICCYNSSARISDTLMHLQKINSHGIYWEVVLVDNASDDDTTSRAQKIWNENPVTKLYIVAEPKKGLMNARIKGVQSSSFNILSFIDDDNWVETEWVKKVYSILHNNTEIAACGGSSEAVFETTPPVWFSEFSRSYATGVQQNYTGFVQPEKGYLWGAGLTVRKQAWDELFSSGFTSLLPGRSGKALTAGEDSEICLAWVIRGWKLWYDQTLSLKHYIPQPRLTLNYLERMYEGFGKAEMILSLYRNHINYDKKDKPGWFFISVISLSKLVQTWLANRFSSSEEKVRNMILWKHQRAYTLELLFNRKKYMFAKNKINKYFTSV